MQMSEAQRLRSKADENDAAALDLEEQARQESEANKAHWVLKKQRAEGLRTKAANLRNQALLEQQSEGK